MSETVVRATGAAVTIGYAVLLGWLAASQPQSFAEVTGGLAASIGAYEVDAVDFDEGRRLFLREQFEAARSAWARADPAGRDARTQFYIAYSYYRQGWGRLYHDDALYGEGLAAIDRAIALAPGGRLVVDDENLEMHTGEELKAELEAGRRREASDFNPMRVFRERK